MDVVAALTTALFGKNKGHVGLIMKDTLYFTLETGTPWEDPENPGSIPTIVTHSTVAHHQ